MQEDGGRWERRRVQKRKEMEEWKKRNMCGMCGMCGMDVNKFISP